METTINIDEFAATLGLNRRVGEISFGRCCGFPTGLKVIDPLVAPLLLFHVRYPAINDGEKLSKIEYDVEVRELISARKLEVDLEDRLAWISFSDGIKHISDGSAARLLKSVLNTLLAAGLVCEVKLCHYCQRQEVETVSCIDEKAVQICPVCLSERQNSAANRPAEATEGAVPIVVLGVPSTLVGAGGWASYWIGYDLLFEMLRTDKIVVPRIVEAVALAFVALMTGGPVGYVIRRVRRRGQTISIGLSIGCTAAAVVLGELIFVCWLIYREFKVISPTAAWKILPQLELDMGGFHLVIKLLAAVLAVVVAVEIAKPRKPKLNL